MEHMTNLPKYLMSRQIAGKESGGAGNPQNRI